MKRSLIIAIVALQMFVCGALAQEQRDSVLWYSQPGGKWIEGMPLGNGFIGAMAFGQPQVEWIALE